jgi:hypothetical protein
MKRPTAEWGEPRSEDHAGIDEIGRFNDTFIKRLLGFGDHRRNKLAA